MRGGFVACLNGDGRVLDQVVEHMRWHHGKGVRDRRDGLEIAALVDGADGPTVDTGGGRTVLVHGAGPAPLAELQRRRRDLRRSSGTGCDCAPAGIPSAWPRSSTGCSRAAYGSPPRCSPWLPSGARLRIWKPSRPGPCSLRSTIGRAGRASDACSPGRRSTSARTEVSSVRYWKPAEALGRYRGSRTEALAEFRERFRAAVRRCYESGSGILLSGGLDSAAVAVIAANEGQARPHLAHVHYPGLPETYEREYAATVAAAVGAPLHVVPGYVDPWDVDAELDGWGGIPYSWLPYGMEDAALAHMAASGVTVALDGHDGDGVLGPLGSNWGDLILKGQFRRVGALAARHGAWPALRGLAVDFLPPHAWLRSGWPGARPELPTCSRSLATF